MTICQLNLKFDKLKEFYWYWVIFVWINQDPPVPHNKVRMQKRFVSPLVTSTREVDKNTSFQPCTAARALIGTDCNLIAIHLCTSDYSKNAAICRAISSSYTLIPQDSNLCRTFPSEEDCKFRTPWMAKIANSVKNSFAICGTLFPFGGSWLALQRTAVYRPVYRPLCDAKCLVQTWNCNLCEPHPE